uniref:ParB protein n=1 Tax=Siphoviridae sp. ctc6d98 TaxID=2825569 RepID=A0A8S5PDP5_9CAUD|nr:MAG TPA: ParB protein [Siphoviridae sp. ctc6d98]
MEIKTLKIGDIHPYEKNPRKNDKSVAAVARSIEEFGWQQPIVVDVNHEIMRSYCAATTGLQSSKSGSEACGRLPRTQQAHMCIRHRSLSAFQRWR